MSRNRDRNESRDPHNRPLKLSRSNEDRSGDISRDNNRSSHRDRQRDPYRDREKDRDRRIDKSSCRRSPDRRRSTDTGSIRPSERPPSSLKRKSPEGTRRGNNVHDGSRSEPYNGHRTAPSADSQELLKDKMESSDLKRQRLAKLKAKFDKTVTDVSGEQKKDNEKPHATKFTLKVALKTEITMGLGLEDFEADVDEKKVVGKLRFSDDEQPIIDEDEQPLDEIDPLDTYMQSVYDQVALVGTEEPLGPGEGEILDRIAPIDEDSFEGVTIEEDDPNAPGKPSEIPFYMIAQQTKKEKQKKELGVPDHDSITYKPIKKNVYVQVREISNMSEIDVETFRKTNGDIKCRGKYVPTPINSFSQIGLPDPILHLLKKRGILKPFPIQMQAIPMLLSGRDTLAVAETGSGKTLAYALPMIRHVRAQPPVLANEGFLAMVIAPTRELAVQIFTEVNRFSKTVNVRTVATYGGGPIGDQLSKLRRGCEIIVGTPGRIIDVVTISNGKVTNLRRCSFVVLDEADRMFDMGFSPQIDQILTNIRPDRQVALFSATFPRAIEHLARSELKKPVEVVVGTRGQSAVHIAQFVEIWATEKRIFRLLQLLGEWTPHGSAIVFVNRQTECDELFLRLKIYGYSSTILHGNLDQSDREYSIQDFKQGKVPILIATSIAARGIDVKSCVLVVNFFPPDHLEDYVHRIGRAGRAGAVGASYTFIDPMVQGEEECSEYLVKVLKNAGKDVTRDIEDIATAYLSKVASGEIKRKKKKGYGGSGFTFKEKSKQQLKIEAVKDEILAEERGEGIVYAEENMKSNIKDKSGGTAEKKAPPTEGEKEECVTSLAAAALNSLCL